MAFPTNVQISFDGYSESHAAITERSEMDRGVPKQRKTQSDVLVQVSIKVRFESSAIADDFEDWYYGTATGDAAAGAAWFDWTDPRTGAVRETRVVAGSLGALAPEVRSFNFTARTLVLEYLRAL